MGPDPSEGRFVHALATAYASGARAAGHFVQLIRIADLDFPLLRTPSQILGTELPPALRSARYALVRSDHLVLLYPLWLGGMPALTKAFLEQLLRLSFTFSRTHSQAQGHNPLKGKTARLITTAGLPSGTRGQRLLGATLQGHQKRPFGLHSLRSTLIAGVSCMDDKEREGQRRRVLMLGGRGA